MKKLKMSMPLRKELLTKRKPKYLKATKQQKSKILDDLIEDTGMNRKYIIRIFSPKVDLKIKKLVGRKKRKKYYTAEDIFYLKKIWEIFDFACGQRMEGRIEEMINKFKQFNEIKIPESIAAKLIKISASTIDRRLKDYKREIKKRLLTTTKPGSLIKNQIPIRTKSWDEKRVGFCELDLVAHCGESAKGEFINSVNLTDILTQWTETEAIIGKAQKRVQMALENNKDRLPFFLKGIDPDNGSEFINWSLIDYCRKNEIEFTRGREYMKNDNAHIEQKNWTHVRQVFGYKRFDKEKQLKIMNDIYRNELRLYKNFFLPNSKLINKERVGKYGAKIKKKYDKPKTPYERVLECNQISEKKKKELKKIYEKLNPVALRRNLLIKIDKLKKIK